MFTIIQSHKTDNLIYHLGKSYSHKLDSDDATTVFDEFVVLVPSMVLGDWLQKAIASKYGISTLVTTTFWGQYQWQIMQMVLEQYNQKLYDDGKGSQVVKVPEVAVLSSTVMQWRLFAYLVNHQTQILADAESPLHAILTTVVADSPQENSTFLSKEARQADFKEKNEQRLWQLAKDFAKVYNRYLTHRSQWLDGWENDDTVPIQEMIDKKDLLSQLFDNNASSTPQWLAEHYIELEVAQRYLWRVLFAGAYQHRRQIEKNFWKGVKDKDVRANSQLPSCLYLFTVQQLPLSELAFLKRLSPFVDVKLFHYNPSQMFWADIVDKKWLVHQEIINPKNVYLRDYGHTLLSRLGKQSRETFATLANLSGNEEYKGFRLDWQDDFPDVDGFDESIECALATPTTSQQITSQQITLLQRLQYDVLMLEESSTQQQASQQVVQALKDSIATGNEQALENTLKEKNIPNNREWELTADYSLDDSLQIHSCHSLQRQLEVLRGRIAYWLNTSSATDSTTTDSTMSYGSRQLSDIVVLLPDVESNDDLIRSVFVEGMGQDGLWLPARVTGVVDKSIRQLWQAICGYYRLLGAKFARFEAGEVLDWLCLPTMVVSLGLTAEQMSRGCELLVDAGFIRGFDEAHLQLSLDNNDHDYRFSFAYALDKLVLGLTMPQAKVTDCLYMSSVQDVETGISEQTLPSSLITLNDAPIIDALCRVYQSLDGYRNEYSKSQSPKDWINGIENQVIHPLFKVYDQTKEMRAIFSAMNGFQRSLRANERPNIYYPHGNFEQNKGDDNKDDLNLRLEFVLESIEESLESQQISAEPTGVITFARFGSLRTVPYKLIVMLNMNLSEFPRQDKDDRYDLMKAGLSERGDRSGEDDDNGAFLDALLCATDNCWIFYNGHSLHDSHEHLPANPVSELLQFLQGEVKWQGADKVLQEHQDSRQNELQNTSQSNIEQYLPTLIENWLVTEHPPLPFSPQIFEREAVEEDLDGSVDINIEPDMFETIQKNLHKQLSISKLKQQQKIPPAPLWSHVYEQLQDDNAKQPNNAVSLPTLEQYEQLAKLLQGETLYSISKGLERLGEGVLPKNLPTHLDINQLVRDVQNPAIHFLRQQQVRVLEAESEKARQEPLALDGLSMYKIQEELLTNLLKIGNTTDNKEITNLLYSPILPAGVSRHSTLTYQKEQINKKVAGFAVSLKQRFPQIFEASDTSERENTISSCIEVNRIETLNLFGQTHEVQLKGQVPAKLSTNQQAKLWTKILPNSARGKHLLRFWLSHLYWQIVRQTTALQAANNDGMSVWHFKKEMVSQATTVIDKLRKQTILTLPPIEYQQAKAELANWVAYSQLTDYLPIVLMPDYALIYMDKIRETDDYYPVRKDFQYWLPSFHRSNMIFDSSSEHEIWQYLLGDEEPMNALRLALQTVAEPVFGLMYESFYRGNLESG